MLIIRLASCSNPSSPSNYKTSPTEVVFGNASANGSIVIGYMMDQLTAPYRVGAIQMALERGQASGLLRGYNFR